MSPTGVGDLPFSPIHGSQPSHVRTAGAGGGAGAGTRNSNGNVRERSMSDLALEGPDFGGGGGGNNGGGRGAPPALGRGNRGGGNGGGNRLSKTEVRARLRRAVWHSDEAALHAAVRDARALRMGSEVRVGTKHLQKIGAKRAAAAF